jgi:hypothetical protein
VAAMDPRMQLPAIESPKFEVVFVSPGARG